jgi:hypothetical protein
MANAAEIAANRLNAQASTRPRTPRGKPAMGGARLRHPPAELGGTARPASGPIGREFRHWVSRANLSNEISGRGSGGEPIPYSREPL